MALGPRSLNRRSVEGRRCKACDRGMAMVNNPNGGRYCRWCGFDPTDEPFEVREARRVIDALSEQLGLSEEPT
jgi:hypothetical protein